MRRIAIIVALALGGCAMQQGRVDQASADAVESATRAWIECGKRNATALARSRIAIKIAAYAAIDACSAERVACGRAMYLRHGAQRTAEIIETLNKIRDKEARDLEAQIADDRAKLTLTQL